MQYIVPQLYKVPPYNQVVNLLNISNLNCYNLFLFIFEKFFRSWLNLKKEPKWSYLVLFSDYKKNRKFK